VRAVFESRFNLRHTSRFLRFVRFVISPRCNVRRTDVYIWTFYLRLEMNAVYY